MKRSLNMLPPPVSEQGLHSVVITDKRTTGDGPDNINELCRVCGFFCPWKIEIFSMPAEERNTAHLIETCLPFIKISEDDVLPKSICMDCYNALEMFYPIMRWSSIASSFMESAFRGGPSKPLVVPDDFKEKFRKLQEVMEIAVTRNTYPDRDTNFIFNPVPPLTHPILNMPTDQRCDSHSHSRFQQPEAEFEQIAHDGVKDCNDVIDNDVQVIDCIDNSNISIPESVSRHSEDSLPELLSGNSSDSLAEDGRPSSHRIRTGFSRASTSGTSAAFHQPPVQRMSDPYLPFRCDLCDMSFSTTKNLWGHVSTCHYLDRRLRCEICDRLFSTLAGMDQHRRTKHATKEEYTCPLCFYVFEAEDDLEKHYLTHASYTATSDNPENSSIIHSKAEESDEFSSRKRRLSCESSASTRKNSEDAKKSGSRSPKSGNSREASLLKQTLLHNHEEALKKRPTLDLGGEDTLLKKQVEGLNNSGNRRKSSRPRKIQKTDEDDVETDSVEELPRNRFHECTICSEVFKTQKDLQKHSLEHESDDKREKYSKPFMCLVCNRSFSVNTALSRHINACHGIDPAEVMNMAQREKPTLKKQDCSISKKKPVAVKSIPSPLREDDEIVLTDDSCDSMQPETKGDPDGLYMCEICGRLFGLRGKLWLHMLQLHREIAAFACGICLRLCPDNNGLYKHWTSLHPPEKSTQELRRYTCQMCGRQHDSRKKLLQHVLIHDLTDGSGGRFDPELIVTVTAGFQKHTDNQDVKEYMPGRSTGPLPEFQHPSVKVANSNAFACNLCHKSFPTEDGLVKHKKCVHRTQSPSSTGAASSSKAMYQLYFVCELCGSSHPTKSERWRHVFKAHNGEPSLTCEQQSCRKVFPTRSLKQEHEKHHQLQGATPNVCEICGKIWGSRIDFWKHLMGVHPDCVHLTCGVCLKMLCTVPELQSHLNENHLPLTEGEFCCDVCGRPYSNKSKMSRHRRIHFADNISSAAVSNAGSDPSIKKPRPASENLSDDSFYSQFFAPSGVTLFGAAKKGIVEGKAKGGLFRNLKPAIPTAPPILFCEDCNVRFESIATLADHRRSVHNLQPCDLCTKYYGKTSHLWKHVKRCHNGDPDLTCPVCSRISASKGHLEAHIQSKHYPRTENPDNAAATVTYPGGKTIKIPTLFPCQRCSKRFWKRYLLKRHQRHCLRPKSRSLKLPGHGHKCEICMKVFYTPSRLKDHEKLVHVPQPCEVCTDVSFTSKIELFTHVKDNHTGHENFTCQFPGCEKLLRCKSDLDHHAKQHKSVKFPPTCSLCGEICMSKARLWNHLSSNIHRAAIPLTCGVCFKYFPTTELLREHVQEYHPKAVKAADTCRICAKTYSSVYKVIDHFQRCHPGYFACKECLAVFTTKAELIEHNETVQCKETSKSRGTVVGGGQETAEKTGEEVDQDDIEHVNQEELEGNGPFPCEVCDQTFEMYSALVSHAELEHKAEFKEPAVGSNEEDLKKVLKRPRRSYCCETCKSEFQTPSDLMEHRKNEHTSSLAEIKKFRCETCDRYFTNRTSYLKHVDSPAHRSKMQTGIEVQDDNTQESSQHSNQQEGDSNVVYDSVEYNEETGPEFVGGKRKRRKVYDELSQVVVSCQLCSKEWPGQKGLWLHLIRNHKQKAATVCGVCLNVCQDYAELSSHLNLQHPDLFSGDGNNFTCKICGRYHTARSKLDQHMALHVVIGPEPQHRPRFVTGPNPNEHPKQQSHKHAPPPVILKSKSEIKCSICSKICGNVGALKTHLKIHKLDQVEEHQRIYNCETCVKSFLSESDFEDHKKTHKQSEKYKMCVSLGAKIILPKLDKQSFYVCDICASVFVTENALTTHLQSHRSNTDDDDDDRNRFPCDLCTATFQSSVVLSLHMNISHKYRYRCSRCKRKSFSSYVYLVKHLRFCSPKKVQLRNLQMSIQLLKMRMDEVNCKPIDIDSVQEDEVCPTTSNDSEDLSPTDDVSSLQGDDFEYDITPQNEMSTTVLNCEDGISSVKPNKTADTPSKLYDVIPGDDSSVQRDVVATLQLDAENIAPKSVSFMDLNFEDVSSTQHDNVTSEDISSVQADCSVNNLPHKDTSTQLRNSDQRKQDDSPEKVSIQAGYCMETKVDKIDDSKPGTSDWSTDENQSISCSKGDLENKELTKKSLSGDRDSSFV